MRTAHLSPAATRIRRPMQAIATAALGALLLATPDAARADRSAVKPSLLEQLRGGGRIIACRDAAAAQARRLGEGIRGQRIPVGPVLAAPGAPTLESARAAFGTAVRTSPLLAGGSDPALPRLFSDAVAPGSNRVLVASEAVLRRMLPHHGRAPLNEGDCLVLWPERGGRPHIQARLAPGDWAGLRATAHP